MEKTIEQYQKVFEKLKVDHKGEPAWLQSLREEAMTAVVEKGFPTVKDEAWRYTDVSDLMRDRFSVKLAENETILTDVPEGIRVKSIPEAFAEDPDIERWFRALLASTDGAFLDLNVALGTAGVLIEIPEGVQVDRPLRVAHNLNSQGGLFQPKIIVKVGKGAKAVLVEDYCGAEGKNYFTNAFTGIVLEEGASLDHYKIQQESLAAFHIAGIKVKQGKNSSFSFVSVSLGSKLTRQEISAELAEGASCRLSGLYLGEGDQHFDHVTCVDHAKPAGKSGQLFKGVLGGNSRGVFTGRVLVRQGAQKTDAHQTNRNLLLSEAAKADSRPQLEILADDVKCGHGSASGRLEEDAVFYFRSRGIGERLAQKILAEGFAQEVLDGVAEPQTKKHVEKLVSEKLRGQGFH